MMIEMGSSSLEAIACFCEEDNTVGDVDGIYR